MLVPHSVGILVSQINLNALGKDLQITKQGQIRQRCRRDIRKPVGAETPDIDVMMCEK